MTQGISIESELRPGRTWRGLRADGLPVVLKRLPDDCLRDGKPHPAIAQRLLRLREVPLTATANLLGVERTDVGIVTVSEFVAGTPLTDLPSPGRSRHAAAARVIVADLHRFGLVHGAIGWGNLVVDDAGELRLIDPSPLLYENQATDAVDLATLFPADDAESTGDTSATWQWRPLLAAVAVVVCAGVAAGVWIVHTAAER